MKTLTYATAFMFAVVSSIFATSAILSNSSAANAASPNSTVCQQPLRPATSGGAIREQLVAIAKCTEEEGSNYTRGFGEQPKSASPDGGSTTNVTPVNPDLNKPDLRSCPSNLKSGTTGGSVREYLEAIQKCKDGH